MLNCLFLQFDTYGNIINSLCAIVCNIVINAFPIYVIVFYNRRENYERVSNNDEDFMAR